MQPAAQPDPRQALAETVYSDPPPAAEDHPWTGILEQCFTAVPTPHLDALLTAHEEAAATPAVVEKPRQARMIERCVVCHKDPCASGCPKYRIVIMTDGSIG